LAGGRNPAGSRARPNSHLPLPRGPAEAVQCSLANPSPSSQRAAKPEQRQLAARRRARSRSRSQPRLRPQRPVSFLRTATTKSKREKLSPTKPIVGFSPNPQQTRHESSIRLEGISGTMLRPCWTLWPTNRSTRAPPRTLFPIAAPVTKPSHRRRANSKLAAPSQAPKEVVRAAPLS
jgi:hypothetical protein